MRQQIEQSIVKEYSYPKEIIKIEESVKLGSQRKRVDIAIYDKNEKSFKQEDVKIIIECKKETISLLKKEFKKTINILSEIRITPVYR